MSTVRPVEPSRDLAAPVHPRAPGPSPWFVAACVVVISFAVAAVLYLQLGFSLTEAGATGFSTLMLMLLAEAFVARSRERAAVERELQAIGESAAGLGREAEAATRRVAALEASIGDRIDDVMEGKVALLTAELQELEMTVAALREEVAGLRAGPARRRTAPVARAPQAELGGAFAGMDQAEVLGIVGRAVAEDRVEVFLQPIVSLPQRRVCHYEALVRLRSEAGDFLLPGDFMGPAEAGGLAPEIDAAVATRVIAIARHLTSRDPAMAVFCNLSAASLGEGPLFSRLAEALEREMDLAGRLVLEFRQPAFDTLGPIEASGLQALGELGLRCSVDSICDLDIDGKAWAAKRVRFVKVDADLLTSPAPASGGHIHVADLGRLLARSGIDLIAARIENEAELVDILDYDIGFGQGHLFSPPRPVRSTFLEAPSGRVDRAGAA